MYPTVKQAPRMKPASPREAIDGMLARLEPVGTERIALHEATGRVLAERISTDRPSPAADVSAMDGYAVRMADITPGAMLPVLGEARIGCAPSPLPIGGAIRVVTGGPIPSGAETVIRREDVLEAAAAGDEDRIVFADELPRVSPGANIRYEGENAAAGHPVAAAGAMLTAALIGSLATVGCSQPLVYRRVRVSVLVTGDEVLPVDASPTPHQLRDSNGPALMSLLSTAPWLEVVRLQRVGDDRAALRSAAAECLSASDGLLLTGGVSMGNYDFVPSVLEELGAETVFHRVPQRPGKPVLGAIGPQRQAILGLPGNPVSVLVTARRMAAAVLRHRAGLAAHEQPAQVMLTEGDDQQLDLWWHRLVRMDAGRCELVSSRGSGDVIAAGSSDGFIEVPPGATGRGPWPFYTWSLSGL